MKRSLLLLLSCLPAFSLQAQSTNGDTNTAPTNPPSQIGPPPMPPRGGPGPMANLTQAEREQLKAAHDKAIQQDPSLEQKMKTAHEAMEEARQAMHGAMLKIDPSVAPILEKITPHKWERKMENGSHLSSGTDVSSTNAVSGNAPRHEGMPTGFTNLTPSEQAQLKAAHEQAKNDPAVIAARETEKNATTPEERYSNKEAAHKAMHDAMIKADPSVETILAKIHSHSPPAPPAAGEGPMMAPQ